MSIQNMKRKGNELTVEQSAAVLTVAMKAYEVGKKARIKA